MLLGFYFADFDCGDGVLIKVLFWVTPNIADFQVLKKAFLFAILTKDPRTLMAFSFSNYYIYTNEALHQKKSLDTFSSMGGGGGGA